MNIILYCLLFIIGTLFGSFCTLAVYRIPLDQDITHKRSYCPNCNHKLGFWDMIPILSYIFLGGRCRYCHKKIRMRYLLIEVFSGVIFTLLGLSINLNIFNLSTSIITYTIFALLYIVGLFLIAGIDKEKIQIRNEVLLYLVIVEVMYIIYLYIIEKTNIYRYVIYLFVLLALVVLNNIYMIRKLKNYYVLQIIILVIIMMLFTYEFCTILTIACTLAAIGISSLIKIINSKRHKCIKTNKNELKEINIPIAFYLSVSNIIMLIITNTLAFYRG